MEWFSHLPENTVQMQMYAQPLLLHMLHLSLILSMLMHLKMPRITNPTLDQLF